MRYQLSLIVEAEDEEELQQKVDDMGHIVFDEFTVDEIDEGE